MFCQSIEQGLEARLVLATHTYLTANVITGRRHTRSKPDLHGLHQGQQCQTKFRKMRPGQDIFVGLTITATHKTSSMPSFLTVGKGKQFELASACTRTWFPAPAKFLQQSISLLGGVSCDCWLLSFVSETAGTSNGITTSVFSLAFFPFCAFFSVPLSDAARARKCRLPLALFNVRKPFFGTLQFPHCELQPKMFANFQMNVSFAAGSGVSCQALDKTMRSDHCHDSTCTKDLS